MNNSKIDIVVPWVDGNDPAWLEEKAKYDYLTRGQENSSNSAQRFRDWELMRYWFRGVEKNMPFVNKIFFVTWGHVPEWLETENERLVIVNHKDYIPEKYLPTYNSNVIELNLYRIEELSENFILFNDDFFSIAPATEDMFFINDIPCDMPVSEICYNYDFAGNFYHIIFNDLGIINKYFGWSRREMKTFLKWINPKLGLRNARANFFALMSKRVIGFRDQHVTVAHHKSIFKKIWELEQDNLDRACMNKFRSPMDFSHFLMRYWNFMTGNFVPVDIANVGDYVGFYDENALDEVCDKLREHKVPILVINDTIDGIDEQLFLKCKEKITREFEKLFPDKCSFEKW